MGQSRPLCLFLSFSNYNFNNTNWKKLGWCAWVSNPRPQDCRHRQNHRAMAAAQVCIVNSNQSLFLSLDSFLCSLTHKWTTLASSWEQCDQMLKWIQSSPILLKIWPKSSHCSFNKVTFLNSPKKSPDIWDTFVRKVSQKHLNSPKLVTLVERNTFT